MVTSSTTPSLSLVTCVPPLTVNDEDDQRGTNAARGSCSEEQVEWVRAPSMRCNFFNVV